MINREHKAMGDGQNSHTPMTTALGGVKLMQMSPY